MMQPTPEGPTSVPPLQDTVAPEDMADSFRGSGGTLPQPAAGGKALPPAVPGYTIEDVLGRGGMGVVYRARHLALKRRVALKMILVGDHAGPQHLARFRAEAEAAARLSHPNIVQVYEVGEHQGRPFCALELIEGDSLAQKLRGGPLPPREAARLLEALAVARKLLDTRVAEGDSYATNHIFRAVAALATRLPAREAAAVAAAAGRKLAGELARAATEFRASHLAVTLASLTRLAPREAAGITSIAAQTILDRDRDKLHDTNESRYWCSKALAALAEWLTDQDLVNLLRQTTAWPEYREVLLGQLARRLGQPAPQAPAALLQPSPFLAAVAANGVESLYPGGRRKFPGLWEAIAWLRRHHPELRLSSLPLPPL